MWIRDGNNSDPGWKKVGSGIWDKYPGSATLEVTNEGTKENYIHMTINESTETISTIQAAPGYGGGSGIRSLSTLYIPSIPGGGGGGGAHACSGARLREE